MRTGSGNLVDQILGTDNAKATQGLLDGGVVVQSDALLVDLEETTLVDQVTDCLEVRVAKKENIGETWSEYVTTLGASSTNP